MAKAGQQWTEQEFAGLDPGDARLNRRAKKLVGRLAAKPTASIPEACDSWSETCAAYRFLRNTDVSWEGILAPHWASTQARMRSQSVVQDTTELEEDAGDHAHGKRGRAADCANRRFPRPKE
ncbi:transposase DNA-binding-containing protein [Burkholderia ubonensis]|uniref:IS4/Tn5 family transposase DNA-binding protein n=1 Tax=Burkholderia ubonensis TaxID=101571 RepID=UPI0039F4D1A1